MVVSTLGPLDSAIFSSRRTMLIFGFLTPGNTPNLLVIDPLLSRCLVAIDNTSPILVVQPLRSNNCIVRELWH